MTNIGTSILAGSRIRCILFDLGSTLWRRNKRDWPQLESTADRQAGKLLRITLTAAALKGLCVCMSFSLADCRATCAYTRPARLMSSIRYSDLSNRVIERTDQVDVKSLLQGTQSIDRLNYLVSGTSVKIKDYLYILYK